MVGMLVLEKPTGLCTPVSHAPTEILEFDTARAYRGQGLGRELLRYGMQGVHPEDEVVLDVAEPNMAARGVYEGYGFRYTGGVPQQHRVFDVNHIAMTIPAEALQIRLGITAK